MNIKKQLATLLRGNTCLPDWLRTVPSYLFKLFQLQETGSSVPLQLGQVGIQLTRLEEAQGVVIPLKSLRIISSLGRQICHCPVLNNQQPGYMTAFLDLRNRESFQANNIPALL